MPAVVPHYCKIENNTWLYRRGKTHGYELLCAPECARLSEHAAAGINLPIEMAPECRVALFAQRPCPFMTTARLT